jgi:hypothetical protein
MRNPYIAVAQSNELKAKTKILSSPGMIPMLMLSLLKLEQVDLSQG